MLFCADPTINYNQHCRYDHYPYGCFPSPRAANSLRGGPVQSEYGAVQSSPCAIATPQSAEAAHLVTPLVLHAHCSFQNKNPQAAVDESLWLGACLRSEGTRQGAALSQSLRCCRHAVWLSWTRVDRADHQGLGAPVAPSTQALESKLLALG